jgi:pimeloyl-ACP methyl ester carboxylesterase
MTAEPRDDDRATVDAASGLAFSTTGDGPAVVLLHGLGGFRQLWREQVEPLRHAGFKVISVDMPGHGDSLDVSEPSIPSFADAVKVLCDSLDVSRAAVVGHSMGGRTMFQFALTYPERLWALVPVGAQSEAPEGVYRTVLEEVRERTIREGLDGFREAFAEAGEIPARTETDPDFASWFWTHFSTHRPNSLIGGLNAILAMERLTPRLGEIQVPALCLVGVEDAPFIPLARRYESDMPRCRTMVIDGCRHYPMNDAAEVFTSALVEFLLTSSPLSASSGRSGRD